MIFKGSIDQAHGRKEHVRARASACRIGDTVQASCSAYPFFEKKTVRTHAGDDVVLVDGEVLCQQPDPLSIADSDARAEGGNRQESLRVC